MDLYTSLTRLKQEMNGGRLPPMTPLPETALAVIDPNFTPGLGALEEDAEKGLRCPIRGCGKTFDALSMHLNAKHADIGGADGLRTLLSIPRTARLVSRRYSKKCASRGFIGKRPDQERTVDAPVRRKANVARYRAARTVGARNLTNECDAQLRQKMVNLEAQIGRDASSHDAAAILGEGFVKRVSHIYGSWNAARARFGLSQRDRGRNRRWQGEWNAAAATAEQRKEAVLHALRAYHAVHGNLPSLAQCVAPTRAPLIPTAGTIRKAMGAESYPEAMRRAASLLNIYGGRYGLPARASA